MTNNIFSDEDSTGLYVYAKNGHAKIETLKTFGMKNVIEQSLGASLMRHSRPGMGIATGKTNTKYRV